MREKDDIFGGYIVMTIEHPNGMETHYGEVNKDRWHVKVGDKVKRGQIIGYIAPRYHELHFQVQTQQPLSHHQIFLLILGLFHLS